MLRPIKYSLLLPLLLATACSQKENPVPTTPYQGQVMLVDEFGTGITDKSGVTVSVVDQAGSQQTTTDAAGNFTVSVPQGTQRLSFVKAGYGTYLTAPLTITGTAGSLAQPVTLGQSSSTSLTFFRSWDFVVNLGVANSGYYQFFGRISAPSMPIQVRYHRLFFATSQNVSPTNYKATALFKGSFADPGGNPTWHWVSDSISLATIRSINAGPSDKIYGIVYGDNPAANTYADPISGSITYPALSKQASAVFECVR